MGSTSKELLDCTGQKPSLIESLLLGKKDPLPSARQSKHQADGAAGGEPSTAAVPTSQVLGKVKDFLGVMAKANEKLELDAQENSRLKYDIEVLDGNEPEYIEMDLLLGVADLHTAEAVAAAEVTMGSFQQSKSLPDCSSGGSSSCSSDTEDGSGDDKDDDDNNGITQRQEDKLQKSNSDKNGPNKRPKIVVLD